MSEKIIRLPSIISLTGLSRSTIYLRISENKFPKQIKLGARSVGWLESEVHAWIEAQIAQSRQPS